MAETDPAVSVCADIIKRFDIATAWKDAFNLAGHEWLEWSVIHQRPGCIVGHTPGLLADQMPDFSLPDFDTPEWGGVVDEAAAHCGTTTEF